MQLFILKIFLILCMQSFVKLFMEFIDLSIYEHSFFTITLIEACKICSFAMSLLRI